jgi:hypothetical protein
MEVPMFFHTLAEFVATILIMLIASGTVIGGMFLYRHFKLRAKELEEELDSRDAEAHLGAVEARLRTVETRLGAMEGAIGALVAGLAQSPAPQPLHAPAPQPLAQSPAPQPLHAPARTSPTAGAAEGVLPLGASNRA